MNVTDRGMICGRSCGAGGVRLGGAVEHLPEDVGGFGELERC